MALKSLEDNVQKGIEKSLETAQKLPGLVKTGLSKGLETLLNQLIRLDEEQGKGFAPCDEKVIQLTLGDVSQTFFIIYQITDKQGEFSVQTTLMGAPDCHIKTRLGALINQQPAERITGDEILAQQFLNALADLEIDWEEHLSHYTGDLVAFKVGHAVRTGIDAKQQAKQKAGDTFKEYLQFEVNLLPTQHQVAAFNQKVNATQSAVDALENRINALFASVNSAHSAK
ncbi:ubiquinone biosynthesis accessory factor UbiJ [Thiosulfativibrio zosterae]|uniref:Ubiquinone biosynthesis accessory factor UbiJ n=1 Tax=Thiosulfativibrio zosterae TaxID=2675053 RepID=A0A6F8PQ00_9GAMM|nr:hypothetical protein [Thiosulfativibrio zosterae]BBP44202.1 hypothetical protein THMIRHAT_19480 [Thiosulfativibrio zosterae]